MICADILFGYITNQSYEIYIALATCSPSLYMACCYDKSYFDHYVTTHECYDGSIDPWGDKKIYPQMEFRVHDCAKNTSPRLDRKYDYPSRMRHTSTTYREYNVDWYCKGVMYRESGEPCQIWEDGAVWTIYTSPDTVPETRRYIHVGFDYDDCITISFKNDASIFLSSGKDVYVLKSDNRLWHGFKSHNDNVIFLEQNGVFKDIEKYLPIAYERVRPYIKLYQ
jgi:hypothetical protein